MSASIVVVDAGPLHYLVLIDCAQILARLFDRILVPVAVCDELLHVGAPRKVKDWIAMPPAWLEITTVESAQPVKGLHKGEAAALQLAIEKNASAVLMDDKDGRAAARRLSIAPIFTVALLELGAEKGFVDLPVAIEKLRKTNFFISPALLDAALERDKQRRNQARKQ